MEVISSCPECGAEYTITDEFFDRPLQCRKCQHIFTVSSSQKYEIKPVQPAAPVCPLKQFAVKNKKFLITSLVLLCLVAAVLILESLMHHYYYRRPKALLHVASYVGTPVQRARAFRRLAMLARNNAATPEEKSRDMGYYFQKGYEVLKGCEETPEVLRLKIALKYKHDLAGAISEEAERLIKIDKSAIFNYVTVKLQLRRNEFGAGDTALLGEYEKFMLEKFAAKPDLATAVGLARLYYFDAPGFAGDLKKMEFYLHKAQEYSKCDSDFWHNWLLIECYVAQGKFDELDRFAEDFVRKYPDAHHTAALAYGMANIYSGKFSSSELHKHGARLNTPVDDAKAARWKALVKKLKPNIIL